MSLVPRPQLVVLTNKMYELITFIYLYTLVIGSNRKCVLTDKMY